MRPVGDSGGGDGASGSEYSEGGGRFHDDHQDAQTGPGESILEQILGLTQEQASLTEESRQILEGLKKVALEIGGVPFERQAVLLPIVRHILAPFQKLMGSRFEAMCESVASTIYDDQASRERAIQLWASLRSRVSHGQ